MAIYFNLSDRFKSNLSWFCNQIYESRVFTSVLHENRQRNGKYLNNSNFNNPAGRTWQRKDNEMSVTSRPRSRMFLWLKHFCNYQRLVVCTPISFWCASSLILCLGGRFWCYWTYCPFGVFLLIAATTRIVMSS